MAWQGPDRRHRPQGRPGPLHRRDAILEAGLAERFLQAPAWRDGIDDVPPASVAGWGLAVLFENLRSRGSGAAAARVARPGDAAALAAHRRSPTPTAGLPPVATGAGLRRRSTASCPSFPNESAR
jgi:hypothetical protein